MVPALVAFGIAGVAHAMKSALWLTAALIVVGGALSGLLVVWGDDPLWMGALCGALTALGGNTALYFYSQWRPSMWNVEVMFVGIAGALPAILLYQFLRTRPH